MARRDLPGAFVPGVPAISGAPGLWPNSEGQVLSPLLIREVRSDRPRPSARRDHGRGGPPAPTARPGGPGKKEEAAAVRGDGRGVKTGPGPPAWQAGGGGRDGSGLCVVRTQLPLPGHVHHQLAPVPRSQGLGTGEGRGGAEGLALGALREGEGSARVAPSAVTEKSPCTFGLWHCPPEHWAGAGQVPRGPLLT